MNSAIFGTTLRTQGKEFLALILGLLATLSVHADSSHDIHNLVIGSVTFDVTFNVGACSTTFEPCGAVPGKIFHFQNSADAGVARTAILNEINSLAQSAIDICGSDPCSVLVPFETDTTNVTSSRAYSSRSWIIAKADFTVDRNEPSGVAGTYAYASFEIVPGSAHELANLEIGSTTYDVSLRVGSCSDFFVPCGESLGSEFTYTNHDDAALAMTQVKLRLTSLVSSGVTICGSPGCSVMVPYSSDTSTATSTRIIGGSDAKWSNAKLDPVFAKDDTGRGLYVYAVFNPPLGGSDIDGDGIPDISDPCPAEPLPHTCNETGSTAKEIDASTGGDVTTPDGNVNIGIDPGVLPPGTTTISVTETTFEDPEVDLSIGGTAGKGQAIAFYELNPDGLDFNPNTVSVTIIADVSSYKTKAQRDSVKIYRLEPDGGGGFGFVALLSVCDVIEDPTLIFTATCVVELDRFSNYGVIVGSDSDGDGVFDDFDGEVDACPSEDASGFDVDGDGCIDTFVGLADLVQTLVDEEVISAQMQNSLLSKVNNAYASSERDQLCTAVNELEAFINQVNAQKGKKISVEAASQVIGYAQSVIAYLMASESCRVVKR